MKIGKKQFIIYLAVAYGIGYIFEILGCIASNNGNEKMFGLYVTLAMFAPFVGAIVAKASFKKMGWRPRLRGNLKMILFSLLTPAICAILGALIFFLIIPNAFDSDMTSLASTAGSGVLKVIEEQGMPPFMVILIFELAAITYAPFMSIYATIGEETGWRGFMYPYLKERYGKTKGRIIGGFIWGVWHWPLMLGCGYEYGKDYLGAPVLGLFTFCLFTIFAGILIDYVYEKSRTIWMAALIHGAINANYMFSYTMKAEYSHLSILGPTLIGVISIIPFIMVGIWIIYKNKTSQQAASLVMNKGKEED